MSDVLPKPVIVGLCAARTARMWRLSAVGLTAIFRQLRTLSRQSWKPVLGEEDTGKSRIICNFTHRKIWERKSSQQIIGLEFGFGKDESVEVGLELVNRQKDARYRAV